MEKFNPHVQISLSPLTGEIEAAYIKLHEGVVFATRDADEDGNAFADYDENGVLLGIELLGPVKKIVLDNLTGQGNEPLDKISRYAPHGLVCA